jgi:hypothetical protein
MCLSFFNNFFWECSKSIAKCTINNNNDFITVYDRERIYNVSKFNEKLYIKDLGKLHDNRVDYLFPLLTVNIDNNEYALNIQKSGIYFDLVGNIINRNMIETILDIEIDGDYVINIIDNNMNNITITNQDILLEKNEYKII